ncbi:MAG TPA: efflux RND transporter periplasmic adaptor subunit [Aliidongia sp.]|nr:efflux RND transporter periplasmic adaptor subunit [Aliidongia sp.]
MTLPLRLRLPSSRPLILLVLVAAVMAGCKGKEDQKQAGPAPKPEVEVVTLHPQPVSLTTELPGRSSPFRVAEVRPQVSGVILKRLFTEGDAVKEGQQLYQIDPAPYEASLASAQATLLRAQASVAVAQATYDRYKPLAAANAVSHQDLDNAVATLRQGQADVASAQASITTAQINLAYTKVLSPISGRTGRSAVTEGALVTADQTTTLATVTQLNPIYVDVTQPSSAILRFRRELAAGQIKTAGDNQAPVKLVLEDGTTYDQPGKLQFSEVTVDQGTGSVTLRAIFPNDQNVLLPGMFVRATLEEGVRQNGILAPQQGVTHNQRGEPTALVVGKDGKVELRTLVTERTIGENWLVAQGLGDGDRLIVKGLQSVRPGAEVAAKEVELAPDGQTKPVNAAAGNAAGDQPAAR